MYSNLKPSISTLEQAHSEIQQLQVVSPVHMYRANSKASTWATTIGSSVTPSTEDTNSGQGQAVNGCAINGAQDHHHQRQVALANFQLSYGQNSEGQVSKIIDACRASPACWRTESPAFWSTESPACWPTEVPIGVQAVDWLIPANTFELEGLPVSGLQGVEVQGDHTPQIISNAQILQSHGTFPNPIAAGAVSFTPNYQHIEGVIPIQTFYAGTEISSNQLQKLPDDPNKWHDEATVTNPATVSALNKHSQVNEHAIPNLVIAATATTAKFTKSQASNSELNAPGRMQRYASCPCPICIYPDKRNSVSREKHMCYFPGCSRVFKSAAYLKVHIHSHTDENFFDCTWVSCGKRFRRSKDLQRHERTHTDETRLQCTECFRRFSRRYTFSQHMERFHSKRTLQEPT